MGYTTGSTYVTWQCADGNVLERWLIPLGLALLTLSWDKNWDSHSLLNGYPSFYPRIALVAPSPGSTYMAICWYERIRMMAYIPGSTYMAMCWWERITEMAYTPGRAHMAMCWSWRIREMAYTPGSTYMAMCWCERIREIAYTPGSTYMAMCWCERIREMAYTPRKYIHGNVLMWTYERDGLYLQEVHTWQCAEVDVLEKWVIPQEVHTWHGNVLMWTY